MVKAKEVSIKTICQSSLFIPTILVILFAIKMPIKCKQYRPYDICPSLFKRLNLPIFKIEFFEKTCSKMIYTINKEISNRSMV